MPRMPRKMVGRSSRVRKGRGRAVGIGGASRLTTKRPKRGVAGGRGY